MMSGITPEIIGKLTDDSGFGFEIRIGKMLREYPQAKVEHGKIYTPLGLAAAPRQFDFRVMFKNRKFALRLAAECKRIYIDAPIVVCGSKRTQAESRMDLVVSDTRYLSNTIGVEQKFIGTRLSVLQT